VILVGIVTKMKRSEAVSVGCTECGKYRSSGFLALTFEYFGCDGGLWSII
jgi:hypothetical protein